MGFDYAGAASRAVSMFERFGTPVAATVNRYTPTVNGTTGIVTKGAVSSTASVKLVSVPVPKGNGREPGSRAKRFDRYFKMPAASLTFEPAPDDEVVMGGVTYLVKDCEPVNPAGTPLVYGVGVVRL
jgi:hypothetical protein